MIASLGTAFQRRLLVLIAFGLLLFGGLLLNGQSLVKALDNRLLEQRMALSARPATGNYVFIAIDKVSLDKLSVWPWPRMFYGDILKALVKAGVKDIALDIDFSVPSTPDQDGAFAQALQEAGGGVILSAFLQQDSAHQTGMLALNRPIKILSDNAWIGAVNVQPDLDGVLRSMPYSVQTADGPLQSVPSLLAGLDDGHAGSFVIDFSINPATVPTYSVVDLLSGKVGAAALAGKSVIVGAHAVELKDYFTVPLYGTMAGPLVQIMATETLKQGRVGTPVDGRLVLSAACAALAFFFIVRPRRLNWQLVLLLLIAICFEIGAFHLFRQHAMIVPTAGVHIALAMVALGRVIVELDIRRMRLRTANLETQNTRQILEQVITDNSDAILIADDAGLIVDMSVRVADVFRPPVGAGPGTRMDEVLPRQLAQEAYASLDAMRAGHGPASQVREVVLDGQGEARTIEYSITPSRLETQVGESFVVCVAARDITLRRRQEAELERLYRYDELTGVLRQSEFVARLDKLLQPGATVAVYSLNLHRFKTINTTLGRDVGDRLLFAAARKLETADARVLLVGRTGGDSFCLARTEDEQASDAVGFAETLIDLLGVPIQIGENRAIVGVHIGLATSSASGPMDGATLLDHAEFALDQAREISGSGLKVFDPAASEDITNARQMERELWRSLERNEVFVTYQPQVRLTDREVIGAEALVRWNNPKFGMISPGDFVQIAEANGFVEKLGQWVLLKACKDAMSWEKPIGIAVNVSALQFSRGDIVADVRLALAESGLPPERLQLEITESLFLNRSSDLMDALTALKGLGVTLALDDFGTGYSSFGYIARFPPDKIKVDQLFVRTLDESAANQTILRSVRSLCQGLGVTMICEGVETESQLRFLLELGCEQGQGWLFGKPQSNEELQALVKKQGAAS